MSELAESPARQSDGSNNRWYALISFAFATVVDGSEGGLINGLFPTIRQIMGLSLIDLGLLTNVNKLISIVFGPLWAMAADRNNRKRILVFVTGVWGLWTVAIGFAQNFTQLLILYFFASIGSVASTPIIMSAVSDLFADRERGRAMGLFGAASVVLAALLTPFFSQFANPQSWHFAYFIVGGLSVLSGFLIWRNFQDPGRGAADGLHQPQDPRRVGLVDFISLFKIPTLVFLFLQKLLNAGLLVWSFGTVYMVDVFGYTNAQAIILVSVPLLLGHVLGNVLGGLMGDYYNRKYPQKARVVLMQTGFFCSALMSYLSTQVHWPATWVFYVMFFIWGIFLSIGTGLDRPMVAAITPPNLRSTAFGLWMSVGDALSSLILVSLVSFFGDRYGLQPVFLYLVTGVMFLRGFVWFIPYRTYPRDLIRLDSHT